MHKDILGQSKFFEELFNSNHDLTIHKEYNISKAEISDKAAEKVFKIFYGYDFIEEIRKKLNDYMLYFQNNDPYNDMNEIIDILYAIDMFDMLNFDVFTNDFGNDCFMLKYLKFLLDNIKNKMLKTDKYHYHNNDDNLQYEVENNELEIIDIDNKLISLIFIMAKFECKYNRYYEDILALPSGFGVRICNAFSFLSFVSLRRSNS